MTPHCKIPALVLCSLTLWGLPALAEEPKAEEPKAEKPKAEEPKAEEPKAEEPKAEEPKAEEPKAEEPKAEEPKAEEPKAEEPKAEEPKAEEPKAEGAAPAEGAEGAAPAAPAEGAAPTEGAAPAEAAAPAPTGWWTPDEREAEAQLLQDIFNEMPKPERRKGNGKLVYPRYVPLVIGDIHNTTAVWGSKLQRDVHYAGISKVHTTARLEAIGRDTPGISFCPLACNRITDIFPHESEITLQYDGPIQDWAGKASDTNSGYSRRFGKAHKAKCSFPLMYPEAPKDTWLDPDKVTQVRDAAIAEIKRYCAEK